ncbi:MAG TPA: hypothetical protein VHZ24_20780 [Pirellulales bacterium]|jgi:hypothetical protein|nr:hypothetical protein [Pirellulales bacterium]
MTDFDNTIADDLTTFDGAETVTLTTAAGVAITVPGVIAQERSPGPVQLISNVLTSEINTRDFHMMKRVLGDVEPASGDTIVDSLGHRWRVQTSRLATMSTRYQLQCTREV